MQSTMALLLAGILIGPLSGPLLAATAAPTPSVEAVVEEAYEQFRAGLGVRQSCSSGVSIVFEELPSRRGEYRTATGEVVIDAGDGADGIAGIVVHELAHHTFLRCGIFAEADFTQAFYATQRLPVGRDWFDYSAGWAQSPAEHFAEAMAYTISGYGEGGIRITSETVGVMVRWLAGDAVSLPAANTHDPVPYSDMGVAPARLVGGEVGDDELANTVSSRPGIAHKAPAVELGAEVFETGPSRSRLLIRWLSPSWLFGPI